MFQRNCDSEALRLPAGPFWSLWHPCQAGCSLKKGDPCCWLQDKDTHSPCVLSLCPLTVALTEMP